MMVVLVKESNAHPHTSVVILHYRRPSSLKQADGRPAVVVRCQAVNAAGSGANSGSGGYAGSGPGRLRAVQEAQGETRGSEVKESREERLMRMQMELLNQVGLLYWYYSNEIGKPTHAPTLEIRLT